MRNLTHIVTAALVMAVMTLLAVMPLVAAWRMPAEQHALELMQHATDLPGQQIQGLSLVY